MDHLDRLESQSIFILREAQARIAKLGMLWSLGKDSNVMVWLAKKAFFGQVPFPVMHIDTGKKFPEMYAFRDLYSKEWNLDLRLGQCPPLEEIDPTLPPAARSAARKTIGLKRFLEKEAYTGIIAGIRRDEESIRAKERVFSPRALDGAWNFRDQPPEFWDLFHTDYPLGVHVRIHPLLQWREIDIWHYIRREGIPVVDLYFAKNGKRYRSLGDQDITSPMASTASTLDEVIAELESTNQSERAGRAMDHEAEELVRAPAQRRIHVMAAEKDSIRLVIVGEVDHGKSTLVGRLLYETGSLPEGKVEAIREVCRKRGRPMEWAFLLDAFQAERDQGITIDTTHIWFNTASHQFVLVDAPGHHEFVRNMVTGAAQSDAALLLIDAAEGLRAQTRRHARLLGLLGVRQVVAAINKMDLVDYSQAKYDELAQQTRTLLGEIGIDIAAIVPLVARDGDNVASRSDNMKWYGGPTLVVALDRFVPPPTLEQRPLRIPVQDVYRIGDRRIIAGRVESGTIKIGDTVMFSPSNRKATVRSIESWPGNVPVADASAGQPVGFTLEEQAFVERGAMVSHEHDAPVESNELRARIFWFGPKILAVGQTLTLRIGTAQTRAQLIDIDRRIGPELVEQGGEIIERNGIADVRLRLAEILPLDAYDSMPHTGRFSLIDGHDVVGGGIVDLRDIPDQRGLLLHTVGNLTAVDHAVPADARAQRNGHQGMVVWLTGLSGAGKSTIGMALERMLFERGYQVYVLDGDNVRRGLNADLSFSANDRTENIRRVAETAALFADAGLIVITAFISPYRAGRDHARKAAGESRFSEIYVKASLEACEQRDPKGLYVKARAGKIAEFTGVSSSYEEPENADLVLDTEAMSIEESLRTLYNYVIGRVKT